MSAANATRRDAQRIVPLAEACEWFDTKRTEVRGYLRTIGSVVNATLPVNVLPIELLVAIFSEAIEATSSRVYILAAVCRYWRDILIACPTFWKNIEIRHRVNGSVALSLERSQNVPISVSVALPYAYRESSIGIYPELLELISPHAHRVYAVSFNEIPVDCLEQRLGHLLSDMPLLEELSLDSYSGWGDPPLLSVPDEHWNCARLWRLSLVAVRISSGSAMLHNLVRLDLADSLEQTDTTLDSLLNILESCPNLEDLMISGCGPQVPPVADIPGPRALERSVSLPKLQSFDVIEPRGNEPQCIAHLLAHLNVPATTHFTLRADDFDDEWDDTTLVLTNILPHDPPLPCIALTTELLLQIDPPQKTLALHAATGDACILHIEIYYPDGVQSEQDTLRRAVQELGALFAAAPVAHLVVSGDARAVSAAHWRAALTRLPALRRLHLKRPGAGAALFDALAAPDADAPPLCPRLAALVLAAPALTWADVDAALRCLAQRAARGTRLESLCLWCAEARGCVTLDSVVLGALRVLVDRVDYRKPRTLWEDHGRGAGAHSGNGEDSDVQDEQGSDGSDGDSDASDEDYVPDADDAEHSEGGEPYETDGIESDSNATYEDYETHGSEDSRYDAEDAAHEDSQPSEDAVIDDSDAEHSQRSEDHVTNEDSEGSEVESDGN